MDAIFTLDQIKQIAVELWNEGKTRNIWAFHAEMGAGKTTLIHAVCEVLGVTTSINSPTFSIINEYNSAEAGIIYHMDWFRLKDEIEAMNAGVDDSIISQHLCLIEWPEKASGLLPDETFHLYITTVDENTRKLVTN